MPKEKPHLNLAVVGHVDNGKSTLVGKLLIELGAVDPKLLEESKKQAKELGKETFEFAFLLDTSREERERGVTIDPSHKKIDTKKYEFTIIDLPGHRDFIKNMITGATQADCAILVVSARPGEAETALGPEGQGREHLILLRSLGVGQIIVAVNKMDTVNYDQKRFEEVKNAVLNLAKQLGYNIEKQIKAVIPVSAYYEHNITKKSDKMPWYNGPTLYEALDLFEVPPRPVDKPLRIPIQSVLNIKGVGIVATGRVETGRLKVGDKVIILPSKKPNGVVAEVKSIEMHYEKMDEAVAGDNIGFNLKGVESQTDIGKGDLVGKIGEPLPKVVEEFKARIYIMYHPSSVTVGYAPVLHAHEAAVSCKIVELVSKIDVRTGQETEKNPQYLVQGEAAIVKFVPLKPLALETAQDFPGTRLSQFVIRDMNKTIGIGQVLEIKAKEIKL